MQNVKLVRTFTCSLSFHENNFIRVVKFSHCGGAAGRWSCSLAEQRAGGGTAAPVVCSLLQGAGRGEGGERGEGRDTALM